MTIRNCVFEDLETVNGLISQLCRSHAEGIPDFFLPDCECFTEESFRKWLENPDASLFCMEDDGKVVGFCQMSFRNQSGFVELKNAHIENIVTDESRRGQGIGHLLMAEAERRAKEWGAVHLNLLCWSFNDGARRLYENLGMQPVYSMMKKDL